MVLQRSNIYWLSQPPRTLSLIQSDQALEPSSLPRTRLRQEGYGSTHRSMMTLALRFTSRTDKDLIEFVPPAIAAGLQSENIKKSIKKVIVFLGSEDSQRSKELEQPILSQEEL